MTARPSHVEGAASGAPAPAERDTRTHSRAALVAGSNCTSGAKAK
jgi:hypothetical protein